MSPLFGGRSLGRMPEDDDPYGLSSDPYGSDPFGSVYGGNPEAAAADESTDYYGGNPEAVASAYEPSRVAPTLSSAEGRGWGPVFPENPPDANAPGLDWVYPPAPRRPFEDLLPKQPSKPPATPARVAKKVTPQTATDRRARTLQETFGLTDSQDDQILLHEIQQHLQLGMDEAVREKPGSKANPIVAPQAWGPLATGAGDDIELPSERPTTNPMEWGSREDGTPKGMGYFGPLVHPRGGVMGELSVGVEMNGKETQIPTLVPTLTKEELQQLLSLPKGQQVPRPIVDKAVAFARQRKAAGLPFYATDKDVDQTRYPDLPRARIDMPPPMSSFDALTAQIAQSKADLPPKSGSISANLPRIGAAPPKTVWEKGKDWFADAARVVKHPDELVPDLILGAKGVAEAAMSLVDLGMLAMNPAQATLPADERMSLGKWMHDTAGYDSGEIDRYFAGFRSPAQREIDEALAASQTGFAKVDQARVDAIAKSLVDRGIAPKEAQRAAEADVDKSISWKTEGMRALDYVATALKHPSAAIHATVQSLPMMYAGGGVGASVESFLGEHIAAGFGEGFTQYLAAREKIRQDNPNGEAPSMGQEAAALASGAGDMLIGMYSSSLAAKLGVKDVDTIFMAAKKDPSARKSLTAILKAIPLAALQEGFFEEFPQGIQEQINENIAWNLKHPDEQKSWYEGINENALMGAFSGAMMGGHAQIMGVPGRMAERAEHRAILQDLFGSKNEPSIDQLVDKRQELQRLRQGQTIPAAARVIDSRIAAVDDLVKEALAPPLVSGKEGPQELPAPATPETGKPTTLAGRSRTSDDLADEFAAAGIGFAPPESQAPVPQAEPRATVLPPETPTAPFYPPPAEARAAVLPPETRTQPFYPPPTATAPAAPEAASVAEETPAGTEGAPPSVGGEPSAPAPAAAAPPALGQARLGQTRLETPPAASAPAAPPLVARDGGGRTRTFTDPLDAAVWNALHSTEGARGRIRQALAGDPAGFAEFVRNEIGIGGGGHDGYSYEVTKPNGTMRVTGPDGAVATYPLQAVAETARRLLEAHLPVAPPSRPPVSQTLAPPPDDLGLGLPGMGQAIADNMYRRMLARVQAGKPVWHEATPSPLPEQIVQAAANRGLVQTIDDVKRFAGMSIEEARAFFATPGAEATPTTPMSQPPVSRPVSTAADDNAALIAAIQAEDQAAADRAAAEIEAHGDTTPHWREGATWNTPDYPAAEVWQEELENQRDRRVRIAQLADEVKAATGTSRAVKLHEQLTDLQAEYDNVWATLKADMLGVDHEAAEQQVEADAKTTIERERLARAATDAKAEKEKEKKTEKKEEPPKEAPKKEAPKKAEAPEAPAKKAVPTEKPTEKPTAEEPAARAETSTVTVDGRPITVVVSPSAGEGERLVTVDVAAVDTAWQRDKALYLSEGGGPNAIDARYQHFGKLLGQSDSMHAPEVAVSKNGAVVFADGRHRFAWLRDHDVTALPVAMDPASIANARAHGYLTDADAVDEPARGPRRRTAVGWFERNEGELLEGALSPAGQAGAARVFKSFMPWRDMVQIRAAMEIYDKLSHAGRQDARVAADAIRDAADALFRETPEAARQLTTSDKWEGLSKAMHRGLQVWTGQEDPDWNNELMERNATASPRDVGRLVFDTLDPQTASFDIEEFNSAHANVDWRRDGETVFPEPTEPVNLWKGRQVDGQRAGVPVLTPEQGAAKIEEWKRAAEAANQPENARKVILSLYDRTGIISDPWVKAGYSVRRFDIRAGEDLTNFGAWMAEVEDILDQGYEIVGVLAQPPCTSFTTSGAQHWPKHDQPGHVDAKTGLTWLERTYGPKAAEHFDTPTEYAQTLVAVVKLIVAQANPRFYAMENPVGRINDLTGLPTPTLKYNPDDFGEPFTKATQLWGEFNPDLPTARVGGTKEEGGEGSRTWNLSSADKDERAETPVGFAYAFFMANEKLAQEEWLNSEEGPSDEPPVGQQYVPYGGEPELEVTDADEEPGGAPVAVGQQAGDAEGSQAPGTREAPEAGAQAVGGTTDEEDVNAQPAGPEDHAPAAQPEKQGDAAPPDQQRQADQVTRPTYPDGRLIPTYGDQVSRGTQRGEVVDVPRARGPRVRLAGRSTLSGGGVVSETKTVPLTEDWSVVPRPTYTDGRLVPREGDKVYQRVAGVGGTPASISGEVYKGPKGLRVRMTAAASLLGGGSSSVGKTQALNEQWTVVGDPAVEQARVARETAEEARRAQDAREEEAFQAEVRRKAQAAIADEGHLPLTRETPVGSRVVDHYSGETVTLDEQRPEYGPLLEGRTLGEPDEDGAWGAYSVVPNVAGGTVTHNVDRGSVDVHVAPDAPFPYQTGARLRAAGFVEQGERTWSKPVERGNEAALMQQASAIIHRHDAATEEARQAAGAKQWAAVFTKTKEEKVGGGTKTTPADRVTWTGEMAGQEVVIRTQPRPIVEGEGFLTSSNARLGGSAVGAGGHFIDVEILKGDSPEVRAQLQALAEGIDTRPVRLRGKNEAFRTGQPGASVDLPAKTPPPATRPATSQRTTAWLNEADIERAVEHFADDPVLGPAARFLDAFKDEVNAHSDGWAYWKQPSHAAGQLQALLQAHLFAGMGAYPRVPAATAAEVQATLAPIKAFMTKLGTKAGMTLPALPVAEKPAKVASRPAVSQPVTPKETEAYRGYLVRRNPLSGEMWVEKDGFRIGGATSTEDAKRTIDMLTAPAPEGATPAAQPLARQTSQEELDARRAANKAKRADLMKRLGEKLGGVSANRVLDPEAIGLVIELAQTYVDDGIIAFKEAAIAFREEWRRLTPDRALDAQAERAFELAWPVKQAMLAGQSQAEAIATVRAQPNRPTVADAVREAYTEAGGADAGGEAPTAGTERDGRGRAATGLGRGRVQPVRASGEGSLGAVSADPGVATAGAGTVEAGGSGAEGGASPAVSGSPVAGAEPGPPAGDGGGAVPPGSLPTAGGTAGPVGITGNKPADYQLTPERIAGIIGRGNIQRLTDNIAALRLVHELQVEHRYATPEEQDALAKYVGWGASDIQQYLEDSPRYNWSANEKALWQELRDLIPAADRKALIRSSPNAHFTYDLYQPIWNALTRFGFAGGRVLEPSVGTGHALGFMDPSVRANSTITASELDPHTAAVASYLYPSARVQPVGFEKLRLARNTQDIAISNVPFGRFGVDDKLFTGALKFLTNKIHSYFFAKALAYVRPGGYIVFVTSRYTMDGPEHQDIRRYLMTQAHFVGAVRLPGGSQGAFTKSAKTEVVTDLIILQKFKAGDTTARNADLFIQGEKLGEPFSTPEGKNWKGKTVPAVNVYRSAWYTAHPEFILGTEAATGSQYRANEYTVVRGEGADVNAGLEQALQTILPEGGYERATTTSTTEQPPVAEGAFKPGEYRVGPNGAIQRVLLSGDIVDATPLKKNGTTDDKAVQRITGQIGIRDARRAVVAAMRSETATDADVKKAQKALQKAYDRFVAGHGHLNDQANVAAFKLDPEAATLRALEELKTTAKVYTTPLGRKVLRVKHEVVGTSDIFRKRTIQATPEVKHVDTPQDALLASLGRSGAIDWAYMARITGDGTVTPERIAALQQQLGKDGRLFEQPDGAWVLRDEYLSGDVVSKLADATAAAEAEPTAADAEARWGANLKALTEVQPAPKTAEDISIALGAHWVDPADVARFVDDTLHSEGTTMRLDGSEQYVRWTSDYPMSAQVRGDRHPLAVRYGASNEKTYGFTRLVDDALNLNTPELSYTVDNGDGTRTTIKQEQQTLAARANLEEVRQLWTQWVYGHKDALDRIVDTYNIRYNRTVARTYDGSHLANYRNAQGEAVGPRDGGVRTAALPGLALDFALYPHQLRAVWRVLTSGNTLLAHEVGAGKTFEMIVSAMEMRRTGRAQKPMITVPTYLLAQWRKDILKAYPNAKLLAFEEKDLASDKRQEAMARIAHGDWDIVLVPHSSFELLKVSPERMAATLQEWIDEITGVEEALRAEHGKDDLSVKKMEDARRRIEDKARKLLAKADKGEDNALNWEDLGVDALMVDEAHAFKNLYFFSKMDQIRGLSRSNADRSLDMFIKIKAINEASQYRNVVFGTATPVMNSLAEVYTMQRYLQPNRLRDLGFENFDNWYATFAQAMPVTEQRPDGSYQEVMRVAKFRNGKLLHSIASEFMDYIGWDDMPYLKLPKLKDGRITILQGEPHPLYPVLKQWFAERLAAIRAMPPHYDRNRGEYIAPDRFHPITGERMMSADGSGPAKDNILTVMADAKLAAIDARLVLGDHAQDYAGSRVQQVSKLVADYYKRETAKKGVALLFLDVGTPKTIEPLAFLEGVKVEDETGGAALGVEETTDDEDAAALATGTTAEGQFNMYEAIKQALIARGVKAHEIAFIHQARNAAERLALFQAAQDGTIRVLLASTDKGGLGMNIQDRLGLVVEVDAPRAMRPGDVRQRHGRAIRAGNTYPVIEIARPVTKGTTDEWLYGLLGKKQRMITDFMHGNLDEYEDVDPTNLSIEASEAYSTQDQRKIELLDLSASLPRLEAQAASAARARAEAEAEAASYRRQLPPLRAAAERLETWARDHFQSLVGDQFAITIGNTSYTSRAEANAALIEALKPIAEEALALESFSGRDSTHTIGAIRGLPLVARATTVGTSHVVYVSMDADAAGEGDIQVGNPLVAGDKGKAIGTFGAGRNLIPSIQERYQALGTRGQEYRQQLAGTEENLARAEATLATPSDTAAKLAAAKSRVGAIESELRAESVIKDAEAEAARQEAELARRQRAPSGNASVGDYAEIPTSTGPVRVQIHPIEVPELVQFSKMLIGAPMVVRRFRDPMQRGEFREGLNTGIRLKADLFKAGNERQLAATLAHEIGHLIDWLPDRILKRGSLLNHLRSLAGFGKLTYIAADGATIKDADVRRELKALSKMWRPWDPSTASKAFAEYRNKATELYADALSAFLNDPGLVEREAPVFYRQFLDHLDQKPEVKHAFFTMWGLLSGTREQLVASREANARRMFQEGNTKAIDLLTLKRNERRLFATTMTERVRQVVANPNKVQGAREAARQFGGELYNAVGAPIRRGLVDVHTPFLERISLTKAAGRTIPVEENPYFALSERPYRISGQQKAWSETSVQPILESLVAHGLTWEDFGVKLLYDRIAIGDRPEIGNPLGLSEKDALEQHDALMASLTPKQRQVLTQSVDSFRAAVKEIARQAWDEGLYTDEQWKEIEKNPAYATFHTIEHMEDDLTARIYRQVGTLKDIRNPGDATTLKTLVTIRSIEHNRAKRIALDYLDRYHPGDIQDAKTRTVFMSVDGKMVARKEAVEPDDPKKALVQYFVKGKLVGKYVDKYVAQSLENYKEMGELLAILAKVNDKFKAVYTTYNPGYQSFNVARDFNRFWKNIPGMTVTRAVSRYAEARHLASVRAFGLASPESSQVRQAYRRFRGLPATEATDVEKAARLDLIEAERAGIISTSFNEHRGQPIDPQMIVNILSGVGVGTTPAGRRSKLQQLQREINVLDGIRRVGVFIESLPKAAGVYEYKGKGAIGDIPADARQHIRSAVGSPDFLAGGTWKAWSNNLLLFSNAQMQGWRSDMKVAVDPSTASGFWTKTFLTNILPKVLMKAAIMASIGAAAAAGAGGGDDDDEWELTADIRDMLARAPWLVAAGDILRKVNSHTLANYIVVPLHEDEDGNAWVLRIPQDDTARNLGGLLWKAIEGDKDFWSAFYDLVDYTAGQMPSQAPVLTMAAATGEYLKGNNPRDYFRQRDILTEDEQKSRTVDPEGRAGQRFRGWLFQQAGADVLYKFYTGDERPMERTDAQWWLDRPLVGTNIASRFLQITQAGEAERDRAYGRPYEAGAALGRLNETRAVGQTIREYGNDLSPSRQQELGRQLARELYPDEHDEKEREKDEKRLAGKIGRAAVHSEGDPLANAVAGKPNAEKVEIIVSASNDYTPAELQRWLSEATRKKVISPQVIIDVKKELAKRRTTVH